MSLSRIAGLAIGLLGLFVIVKTLPAIQSLLYALLPSSLTGVEAHDPGFYRLFLFIMVVSSVIGGLVLFVFRESIGTYIAGETKDSVSGNIEFSHLHSAAFSVLGIYFFINGCSKFLGKIIPALIQESHGTQSYFECSSAVELLLGLFLFLGASGLAKLWSGFWIRIKNEWKGTQR